MGLEIAFEYLKQARCKAVQGVDFTRDLGRALHYIQDVCVSPYKRVLFTRFKSWDIEEGVSRVRLDLYDVKKALGDFITPSMFSRLIKSYGFKDDVVLVVKNSAYPTALAVNNAKYYE